MLAHVLGFTALVLGCVLIGVAIGTHTATCYPLGREESKRNEAANTVFWFGISLIVAGAIGYFVI